jgi:hypothetical protein
MVEKKQPTTGHKPAKQDKEKELALVNFIERYTRPTIEQVLNIVSQLATLGYTVQDLAKIFWSMSEKRVDLPGIGEYKMYVREGEPMPELDLRALKKQQRHAGRRR